MSRILVVAAHPDDEILGAGGTLARHVAQSDEVFALILGEGQTSRWSSRESSDKQAVEELRKDTLAAAEVIGFSKTWSADLPDNRFDTVALLDIVKCVEKYTALIRPEIVYTHHAEDLNIDHRITFEAVLTAARPIGDYSVKEIYAFETVSSTEWNYGSRSKSFCPNVCVDIEAFFERKCEAMKEYRSELCRFPHPRSLEMLDAAARRWGATVGKTYAEAFELIRKVI